MDPAIRGFKESLSAHLPVYNKSSNELVLPAYLGSTEGLRLVKLPTQYHSRSKKEKQGMLALIACARLHKLGLLSDRLLPLSRDDIQSRILSVSTREIPPLAVKAGVKLMLSKEKGVNISYYCYRLQEKSKNLNKFKAALKSTDHTFGIITPMPLSGIPKLTQYHPELGDITCSWSIESERITLSENQLEILVAFFTLVWNHRWKRKTRSAYFRFCRKEKFSVPSSHEG